MHPEISQQFGVRFARHYEVVADGTVVRDRLTCFAAVTSIVATEAASRVGVTDIVWMSTPTYIHRGKDII